MLQRISKEAVCDQVRSMASPTEAPTLCVDGEKQNPTDIFERLKGVEKELVRLKWQLQGSNLAEKEIQELLKIVREMKIMNQNIVDSSEETEKEDDRGQSSGGRAREPGLYNVGGSQSFYGVGGIGSTNIRSNNSPINFHSSKNDQTGKQ